LHKNDRTQLYRHPQRLYLDRAQAVEGELAQLLGQHPGRLGARLGRPARINGWSPNVPILKAFSASWLIS
jgi:hypothetical protein